MSLKHRILRGFRRLFRNVGGVVYDYPHHFIIFSTILGLIFGVFFLFIQFENRADILYAMPVSQSRSDLAKQTAIFGAPPRVNMLFIISADDSDVLTRERLAKLDNLVNYISNEMPIPEYPSLTYQDVCYKHHMQFGSSDASDCVIRSALDMYRSRDQFGIPVITRQWPYVPNLIRSKITKADLSLVQPQISTLKSGAVRINSATGFIVIFEASNDPDKVAFSYAWEAEFINFINEYLKQFGNDKRYYNTVNRGRMYDFIRMIVGEKTVNGGSTHQSRRYDFNDVEWSDFNIIVNAQRSWQDELTRTTKFDVRLIFDYVIAYLLIASYMIASNATSDLVRSKAVCGVFGSISAFLGFVVGGGFCYAIGFKHTPTMHATPFLVLAIGLDNTFVVLNFYTLGFAIAKKPRRRCQLALADSGIALFITTITSVVSFTVGAVGPYVAVRNFCIVTSCGLIGGFVYNIIFFYPILSLEARAEAEGRVWFLPQRLRQRFGRRRLTPESVIIDTWSAGTDITPVGQDAGPYVTTGDPNHLELQTGGNTSVISQGTGSGSHLTVDINGLSRRPQPDIILARAKFMKDRNMFEVASLQWTLTKLRLACEGEARRREREFAVELNHSFVSDTSSEISNRLEHRSNGHPDLIDVTSNNNDFLTSTSINRILDTQDPGGANLASSIKLLSDSQLAQFTTVLDTAVQITEEPKGNKGKKSRKNILRHVGPIIQQTKVLYGILLLMGIYIVLTAYLGISHLSAGLDLEHLTPPDSYLREAFELSHSKIQLFAQQTTVAFTAPKMIAMTPLRRAQDLNQFSHVEVGYVTHPVATSPNIDIVADDSNKKQDSKNGRAVIYVPDDSVLDAFSRNDYGRRVDNKNESDISGITSSVHDMSAYYDTLGELPFWEPDAVKALLELDHTLRRLHDTQDILNGIILFYQENAHKILNLPTYAERRQQFYNLLANWLRNGVVGRHVREQFHFDNNDLADAVVGEDGSIIPPLKSVRIVLFHYNFLNSYVQSRYMVELRNLLSAFSETWSDLSLAKWTKNGDIDLDKRALLALKKQETFEFIKDYMGSAIRSLIPRNREKTVEPTPLSTELQRVSDAPYPRYKDIANRSKLNMTEPFNLSLFSCIPFMETFLYFETDINIWNATGISMISAFLSIVLVSSVLLEGVLTIITVVMMIVSVDLGVFGLMSYFGIHLNILSMILLVLSIGFSVDYTVHVIHTYCHTVGKTSQDRTVETLILICNPIFHGAASTLVAILPIYFRDYYVLKTFYYMTALVICFGFLNGAIFLPAVLAVSGNYISEPSTKKDGIHYDLENLLKSIHSSLNPDDYQTVVSF